GVSMNRRRLETLAVARWADLRRKSPYASTPNILPLGDFNLPKTEPGDPIYDQLTGRGLHLPEHSTQVGSSIAEDAHYDQIAFFPGPTEDHFTGQSGVFDYDGAVFRTLYEKRDRPRTATPGWARVGGACRPPGGSADTISAVRATRSRGPPKDLWSARLPKPGWRAWCRIDDCLDRRHRLGAGGPIARPLTEA